MKKVLTVLFFLLLMAQGSLAQGGMAFNAGAIYVSNYQGETNMTFQTASRPCRIWSSNYNTLIRFDEADLAGIPCGAPCTLYFSKDGKTNDQENVWNSNNINVYLLKGTWMETGNDVDQTNFADAVSWDYRAYPKGWKTGADKAEPITGAFLRKNTKAANNGPDKATPGFCVIDKAIIDLMRAGQGTGFILQPGSGCMLWLPHIGHQMNWGDEEIGAVCTVPNGVESSVKTVNKVMLLASPNPMTMNTVFTIVGVNPTLTVYNLNGQKVVDLTKQIKDNTVAWNTTNQPNGVYLAELISGNTHIVKQLTIVH